MERHSNVPQLSPRELQLIQYAALGYTDTAIAQKLGISESTVGTYWGRVRIKIGPYNRTELVSIFLQSGQEEVLHELRDQNARLSEQLERANVAIESGTIYQQIIENAPDALLLVDELGLVQRANQAAREMFGYETHEMDGMPLEHLIPVRFREIHRQNQVDFVRDGRRHPMGEHLSTPALRKDGSEFLIRATLAVISSATGVVIACAIREHASPTS